jgi:hypothetical protein
LSTGGGDTGDFLGRWSRRKRANEPDPADEAEVEAALEAVGEPAEDPDRTDEEVLSELGLPEPDTMKAGDDFSAFMSRAVPRRLRERALRRLWVSDPVLANLDGLVDYADDYTGAGTVPGKIKTAYKVGRGFLDDVTKIAGEPDGDAAPPAAEITDTEPGAEDSKAATAEQVDVADVAAEPEPPTRIAGHTGPDLRQRGKMRFRLAEE